MATLISIERFRRRRRDSSSAAHEEDFWRKAMLPSAIVMGVIVAISVGALVIGIKEGIFTSETMIWVLIGALVSVFALTKIVIANVLFFVLANEKPRVAMGRGPRPTYRAPIAMRSAGKPRPPRTTSALGEEAAVAAAVASNR